MGGRARAAAAPVAAPVPLRGRLPEVSDESLVELLYRGVGDPAGWQRFVEALGQAYGSGFGNLITHDFAAQSGLVLATGLRDPGLFGSYHAHYAPLNPWLPGAGRAPVGAALSTQGMVPEADLARSEFVQDWCRPQGIDGGVVVTVQRDECRILAVSAFFSKATFEQLPDVTARLQRLTPHLLRVAQLNRQFAGLEARAGAAEEALARLATAMVLLTAEGRVLYLNARAERIMAAADGLAVRSDRLETARPRDTEALRALIAQAARAPSDMTAAPGGVMRVPRRSGQAPYEVLVAPISGATVGMGSGGPMAAIFIREPAASYVTPVATLRAAFSLTAAEARLMQALLAGDDLRAAGDRLGVTYETARSQIKAIFLKTGAKTQSDLVRMGLRSLTAMYR